MNCHLPVPDKKMAFTMLCYRQKVIWRCFDHPPLPLSLPSSSSSAPCHVIKAKPLAWLRNYTKWPPTNKEYSKLVKMTWYNSTSRITEYVCMQRVVVVVVRSSMQSNRLQLNSAKTYVLRQIRIIISRTNRFSSFTPWQTQRVASRSALQPLVVSLVFIYTVTGAVTFGLQWRDASLPSARLLERLQSVPKMLRHGWYASIWPLESLLHDLYIPECSVFHLAVHAIVYRFRHGLAPPYLAHQLQRVADSESRQRLRTASSTTLVVPKYTVHSTIGDRACFPVAIDSSVKQPSTAGEHHRRWQSFGGVPRQSCRPIFSRTAHTIAVTSFAYFRICLVFYCHCLCLVCINALEEL